jgi:hypothetical protein
VRYLASPAADVYSAGLILLRILLPANVELPASTTHVSQLIPNAWYVCCRSRAYSPYSVRARLDQCSRICSVGCWSRPLRATPARPCGCSLPSKQDPTAPPPPVRHLRVIHSPAITKWQRRPVRRARKVRFTHRFAPPARLLQRRYAWSMAPRCKTEVPEW